MNDAYLIHILFLTHEYVFVFLLLENINYFQDILLKQILN